MLGRSLLMKASGSIPTVSWTPAAITTTLWLDAADTSTITQSGGFVNTWTDKSGTGKNATQFGSARPTYAATGLNGLPAIDFNGSNDDLVLSSTVGLNSVFQSFFIVAKRDNSLGRTEIAFGVGDSVNGDGIGDVPRWTDNAIYSQIGYLGNRLGTASAITDLPYINAVTGGTNQRVFTNGALMGTGTTQSTANFSVSSGGFIGSGKALSVQNRYFDGKISELIIVPSVADLTLRQLIEGYLAHKWGLAANLPNDHPYKNAAPTIQS
jgi:hypothetical protein